MYLLLIALILNSYASYGATNTPLPEKELVILTLSYNNATVYKKNLDSIFAQNYDNYYVIYVDDCSPDGTGDLVEQYVKECGQQDRVRLIKNKKNYGATANIYNAVHTCKDNVIILMLDGDDWFAHNDVLATINKEYSTNDIWLTYGQFEPYYYTYSGRASEVPESVIEANSFREYPWVTSALRTHYAWLFKEIKREDLLYNNEFIPIFCDIATMWPMLEMAGKRTKFISEVLYVYNLNNPLTDAAKDPVMQQQVGDHVRALKKYKRLDKIPDHVKKP